MRNVRLAYFAGCTAELWNRVSAWVRSWIRCQTRGSIEIMKLSAQEEYGVRCLIQVAGKSGAGGITIPEISKAEGISPAHAAKLLRILRRSGFVKSVRGKVGGYSLSRPSDKVLIMEF